MIKEVTIPDNLNDLTLGQWQKIMIVSSTEGVTDDLIGETILEVVYGIKKAYIEQVKSRDIEKLINDYRNAIDKKPQFRNKFKLDGVLYGFIPNLDDITAGELIDIDSYGETKNHHLLMSVLYRPIINTIKTDYQIESYTGTNEILKDMPLGVALGAAAFFLSLGMDLQKGIIQSLKEEDPQSLNKALAKNGAGINLLTRFPTGIFCDLMI